MVFPVSERFLIYMINFIKENKKLLIALLFFLCLTIAGAVYLKQIPERGLSNKPLSQDLTGTTSQPTVFDNEAGAKTYFLYVGKDAYETDLNGTNTVYDLMDVLKKQGKISFEGKFSQDLGFFVEEINGIKNNPQSNEYWLYYINNKISDLGVSNYFLKTNDVINWKYEKPQF
jgi:hypothetical protein